MAGSGVSFSGVAQVHTQTWRRPFGLNSKRVFLFAKRSRARATRAPKSHFIMGWRTTVGGYNTCACHKSFDRLHCASFHLFPHSNETDYPCDRLPTDLSHFCVLELSVASHRALVSNSSLVSKRSTRADNIPTCLPLDRHHHVCKCTAANPTKNKIPTPTFCVFFFPQPTLSPMLCPQ
jgi:hypothetical protein